MESDQAAKERARQQELEQEALLARKYGGVLKRKPLMPKDHKYFDSADWALAKEGKGDAPAAAVRAEERLPPRTEPAPAAIAAQHPAAHLQPHRPSKLEPEHP